VQLLFPVRYPTFSSYLFTFCVLTMSSAAGASIFGKGDPLLNPLFQEARQQSFSSMRLGEYPARTDVGVATISLGDVPGRSRLHLRADDSRFNTTGHFLVVEDAASFRMEFGARGVQAFAFNFARLDRDLLVELYDDGMRLVDRFWVRAFASIDNNRVYLGAYSPYVAVHHAVFTFAGTIEAFCVDNLTVMEPALPTAPNLLIPLRAVDSAPPVSVPDTGSAVTLLALTLVGMAFLRAKFR
jgi:hypothetical protein